MSSRSIFIYVLSFIGMYVFSAVQAVAVRVDHTVTAPHTDAVCLAHAEKILTPEGTLLKQYDITPDANIAIDARKAIFIASMDNLYPAMVRGGFCWVGGIILGDFDPDAGWYAFKKPNRTAFNWKSKTLSPQPVIIDGLRIDNNQDGIRFSANVRSFDIRNVHMTRIHDDCVENDFLVGGRVEDSLLDGCYTGFSARPSEYRAGQYNHGDRVWEIHNNLVRMEPIVGPYKGPSPGHGAFFKWASQTGDVPPKLSLHGNIFLITQEPNGGNSLLEGGKYVIDSCSDNVLIWTGEGKFPGGLGKDPKTGKPCFTVSNDLSLWNSARNSWLERHTVGNIWEPVPETGEAVEPLVIQSVKTDFQTGSTQQWYLDIPNATDGNTNARLIEGALEGSGHTVPTIIMNGSGPTIYFGQGGITLQSGTGYRLVLRLKATHGGSVKLHVREGNWQGSSLGLENHALGIPDDGTWKPHEIVFTASQTTENAWLGIEIDHKRTSQYYIDDVVLEAVTVPISEPPVVLPQPEPEESREEPAMPPEVVIEQKEQPVEPMVEPAAVPEGNEDTIGNVAGSRQDTIHTKRQQWRQCKLDCQLKRGIERLTCLRQCIRNR